MAHDLVIRNGVVIDGTGSPGFEADVAVDGENITAIGKNLGAGKKEIDAKGHVVAPGFIDSHTHMDAFVVLYPNGNPVVNYGVTTIIIGDCGASCAPVPPKAEPRQVLVQYLRRVLDKYVDDKDWKWNTFGDYLNYIEGKIAINVAAYASLPGSADSHGRSRLCQRGESRRVGRHEENGSRRHGVGRHRILHESARRTGDSRRHAEHVCRAR